MQLVGGNGRHKKKLVSSLEVQGFMCFYGKQEKLLWSKNLSIVNKLKFLSLLSFFPEVYTSTRFVPFPIILCKLVVGGIYKVKYKSNWNQS